MGTLLCCLLVLSLVIYLFFVPSGDSGSGSWTNSSNSITSTSLNIRTPGPTNLPTLAPSFTVMPTPAPTTPVPTFAPYALVMASSTVVLSGLGSNFTFTSGHQTAFKSALMSSSSSVSSSDDILTISASASRRRQLLASGTLDIDFTVQLEIRDDNLTNSSIKSVVQIFEDDLVTATSTTKNSTFLKSFAASATNHGVTLPSSVGVEVNATHNLLDTIAEGGLQVVRVEYTRPPTRIPTPAPSTIPIPSPTPSPTLSPPPTYSLPPTYCYLSTLKVEASGFDSTKGVAKIWVINDRDSWNNKKDSWKKDNNCVYVNSQDITDVNDVSWEVTGVDPGTYGVMVLHDEDENGNMDANWVGIPEEGVGASNGASGGPSGGPSWSDAKFSIGSCSYVTATISMWYS